MNQRNRTKLTGAVFAAITLLWQHAVSGSTNSATQAEDVLNQAKCTEIVREAVARFNALLETNAFSISAKIPKDPAFQYSFNKDYRETAASFGNPNSSIEARLLAKSGRLTYFSNWDAFRAAYGKNASLFEKCPTPKWKAEKAIALASNAVVAVLGRFPENLALDEANYRCSVMEARRYYTGAWGVRFARIDKRGNRFVVDCVKVFALEEYGPYDVVVWFNSNYNDRNFQPLSEEQAIQKARSQTHSIMDWTLNRVRYWNHVCKDEPSLKLEIVNPNHLTTWKDLDEVYAHRDPNARLAWVITFKTQYAGPPNKDGPWKGDGKINVWIDAENGEFLGGDFD